MGKIADFEVSSSSGNEGVLSRTVVRRFAAGSIGTGGFGTLPGLVLVYYLTDSLGVTALLAGVVVTLAKLWDVAIDPIIGELSDASARKTGSRRRFMVIGAFTLPVFFVLTFSVPQGLSGIAAAAWVFVCFIGAATAFSLFQVPYISLPAELTTSYNERTRLLTWRVVVLTVAILAFGGGGPALRELAGDNQRLGYVIMASVAALAFAVAFLISASVAPKDLKPGTGASKSGGEKFSVTAVALRALRDTKHLLGGNKAFRTLLAAFFAQALATGLMLAAAQYVATWILKDESAVTFLFVALIAPALFMAPVWGRIAERNGKERSFQLATVIFAVGSASLLGMLWAPGPWIYLPVALCGASYAGMQSLPMAMLPDVITYSTQQACTSQGDSSESSPYRAGVFGGVWTAGETTGLAMGTTIMTILLAINGYQESINGAVGTQPQNALVAIALAFSIVPALCTAASLLAIRAYPLNRTILTSGITVDGLDLEQATGETQ